MTETFAGVAESASSGAGAAVAVLPSDRHVEARVIDAVRASRRSEVTARGGIVSFPTAAHLRVALAARPFVLLVAGPRDVHGAATEDAIRAIRTGFPSLPVVGYVYSRPGVSADVLALARAGVHELVMHGVDDAGVTLQAILANALRRSVVERVERHLSEALPEQVLPFVRYCLTRLDAAPTVPAIAQALGVHRKTLVNWMRAARLPPPRTMATWCRLLVAASLLEDPGRSIEYVALSLDFPSGNAFRNVLRRYAGMGPTEVRAAGGMAALVERFTAALKRGPGAAATARETPAAPPFVVARDVRVGA